MRIHNVHERVIEADPEEIAPLLTTLGQPNDALYPPLWEPMRLDGPVAIGSTGTHGTISAYRPGRLIEFTFPEGIGITGTHVFTVAALGPRRSRVSHSASADANPAAWVAWKTIIEPSHDAVLEELLDRLETAVGTPPARPFIVSRYARALRRFERPRAREVEAEQSGLIVGSLPRVDDSDVFVIERRRETSADPEEWAQAIFEDLPPWVDALMELRERLVGLVGIDRGSPDAFAVYGSTDDEVLLGVDAGHLNFRTAVRCEPERVVMSGAVQLHNRRARAYYALIRRLHPLVVRTMLNRAASRLARRPDGAKPVPTTV